MALIRLWYTLAIWWCLRCVIAIVLDWRKRRRMAKLSRALKMFAPLANEMGISVEDLAPYLRGLRLPLVGYNPDTDSLHWLDLEMSRAVYDDAKALGISLPAAVIDKEGNGE